MSFARMRCALHGRAGFRDVRLRMILGAGVSTLNPWGNAPRDTDVVSAEDRELARRITAWARDPHPQGFEPDPRNSLGDCFPGERGSSWKKATQFFASQKR
jgi:hypothetical protein